MAHSFFQQTREQLARISVTTWVFLGFLITFLGFFVVPIFYDPSQVMQFKTYFPIMSPIGHDYRVIAATSRAWIDTGQVPPILYPSFTLLFFAPFAALNVDVGYRLITLATILCFVWTTLTLPRSMGKSGAGSTFGTLILITGLLSYGLQFELERGQWNMIAMAFCLFAIYVFHYHPRFRWLAYALFSIAVQLKIYPAIFVLCLVDDWSDWKHNLRRLLGLGLTNLLALFVFGLDPVRNMILSLVTDNSSHSGTPFNLSITSFSLFLLSSDALPRKRIFLWLMANKWVLQAMLLGAFGLFFLVIIRQAIVTKAKGVNPSILMACSIGACMIPSISFDYKLSFLPAVVATSIPAMLEINQTGGLRSGLLAFIFSVAYSSMLYSYVYKPVFAQNNLPALFILLAICTWLSLTPPRPAGEDAAVPAEA